MNEEPTDPAGATGPAREASPATPPSPPTPQGSAGLFDLFTMGISIALCIAIGLGGGYALDAWLGTAPIFTFVGLAVGLVGAVATTVVKVRRLL